MAKWKSIGEDISIVLIVIGVLGMCQPYTIALYTYSFTILLVGTLAYIVIGYFFTIPIIRELEERRVSIYFGDKSWPQLKEAIERDTLIILPVAQVEEHGRHLPLSTDTVIATETARLVAKRLKDDIPVLVMPAIWSGYSMKVMTEWPGVIRLQPETMLGLVYDVLSSLVEMGFKKIVIINSHGQNPAILELAARKIADHYEVYPAITYVLAMAGEVGPEVRRSEIGGCGGHGCEAETSLMLYLSDLVDMSQATDQDTMRYHSKFYPGDIYYTGPKGPKVFWSGWKVQKSKTGLIGDPTLATAETGKALMEAIVQNHVEFITEFYHHTPVS